MSILIDVTNCFSHLKYNFRAYIYRRNNYYLWNISSQDACSFVNSFIRSKSLPIYCCLVVTLAVVIQADSYSTSLPSQRRRTRPVCPCVSLPTCLPSRGTPHTLLPAWLLPSLEHWCAIWTSSSDRWSNSTSTMNALLFLFIWDLLIYFWMKTETMNW